jgi:hypothetical protein
LGETAGAQPEIDTRKDRSRVCPSVDDIAVKDACRPRNRPQKANAGKVPQQSHDFDAASRESRLSFLN